MEVEISICSLENSPSNMLGGQEFRCRQVLKSHGRSWLGLVLFQIIWGFWENSIPMQFHCFHPFPNNRLIKWARSSIFLARFRSTHGDRRMQHEPLWSFLFALLLCGGLWDTWNLGIPGIPGWIQNGGFQSHGGTPIAGWFISWKILLRYTKIWMQTGDSPILGNHQMRI